MKSQRRAWQEASTWKLHAQRSVMIPESYMLADGNHLTLYVGLQIRILHTQAACQTSFVEIRQFKQQVPVGGVF